MKLGPQLFGGTKPDKQKMHAIGNWTHWKPYGGLWTSSYHEGSSGWVEWAQGENFKSYRHAWLLRPVEARIFELDGRNALTELIQRYSLRDSFMREPMVDWQALARDYDALWLPDTHLRMESMLVYSFDCESTIWFRWCFQGKPERVELHDK